MRAGSLPASRGSRDDADSGLDRRRSSPPRGASRRRRRSRPARTRCADPDGASNVLAVISGPMPATSPSVSASTGLDVTPSSFRRMRTSASSAPKPPAFVKTGIPSAFPPTTTPSGIPSSRLSTIRMPDAPSCASVSRAPSPPISPRMSHCSRSTCSANARARLSATAALSPRSAGASRTTTSGKVAFEPSDLCVRHRVQRAHLQENTGIPSLWDECRPATVSACDGGSSTTSPASAPASPPEPTANDRRAGGGDRRRDRHQICVCRGIDDADGCGERGSSCRHVARGDRRHRIAAECRALDRLPVERATDSTRRSVPSRGYAGHTTARASGWRVRHAASAPATCPCTDPRIVESIFRNTRSTPALIKRVHRIGGDVFRRRRCRARDSRL